MKKHPLFILLILATCHSSLAAETGQAAISAASAHTSQDEEPLLPTTLQEEETGAIAALPPAANQGDMTWKNWAFIGSALALAVVGCSIVAMNQGHHTD